MPGNKQPDHTPQEIVSLPNESGDREVPATELIQDLYFPLKATKNSLEKSDKANAEETDVFLQDQLKKGNFCLKETNTAIKTLTSTTFEGKAQNRIDVLDNCFNNLRTTIESIGHAEDEDKTHPRDPLRLEIVQDLRNSFENCLKQYQSNDKDLNNQASLLRALKELKNDILILRKDEHIERLANYANFVGSTEKQLPLDSVLLSIHKASSQASYFADTITNVISVQDNALPANNENQTLTITALKTLEKDLGQRIDILENITSLYNNEPVGNSNSGSQKLVEMSNLFPDKLYTDQTNIIFTKDKSWNKLREHISGSINTFKKLNTLIDRLDEDADNATLMQIKAISTDLANKLSLNDYTRVGADTAGTYWNAWHTTGQWSQRLSYLSLPSDYKNILVNSKELSDSLNSLYNTELFQGTGKHLKPISPDLIRPILSKQIASIESGIKSLKHNLDHCSAASELDQLIIEKGTANFRQELPNFEDKFVKLKTLSLEISSPKKIRGKQLSNIYQEINALAESLSSDLAFLHRDSIAESTQVGGIEKIGLF